MVRGDRVAARICTCMAMSVGRGGRVGRIGKVKTTSPLMMIALIILRLMI